MTTMQKNKKKNTTITAAIKPLDKTNQTVLHSPAVEGALLQVQLFPCCHTASLFHIKTQAGPYFHTFSFMLHKYRKHNIPADMRCLRKIKRELAPKVEKSSLAIFFFLFCSPGSYNKTPTSLWSCQNKIYWRSKYLRVTAKTSSFYVRMTSRVWQNDVRPDVLDTTKSNGRKSRLLSALLFWRHNWVAVGVVSSSPPAAFQSRSFLGILGLRLLRSAGSSPW